MPTYEYECKSCGHGFEVFQSMSDQPVKDCPACGKEVRRLIFGGTGVIFKGSGFYVNDKGKGQSKPPCASAGKAKTEAPSGDVPSSCANCPAAKASSDTVTA
jgi:putative FmdB family regulatory protein